MIRLCNIDEKNWLEAAQLKVWDNQTRYAAPSLGILARGYVYRHDRARVLAFSQDGSLCGLGLFRDRREEPACYELMEFMIDWRYQGQGNGQIALGLMIGVMHRERAFPRVRVCIQPDNEVALHLCGKVGFRAAASPDPARPDDVNLFLSF